MSDLATEVFKMTAEERSLLAGLLPTIKRLAAIKRVTQSEIVAKLCTDVYVALEVQRADEANMVEETSEAEGDA